MRMSRDDRMWSECLDDEAGAAQAEAYRRGLSPDRRDLLSKEAALEAKIVERLADGAECPDGVWERTRRLARERTAAPRHALDLRWLWAATGLTAAAVISLALLVPLVSGTGSGVDILAVASSTGDLSREAEVTGDMSQVRTFLEEHGYELAFQRLPPTGHVDGHGVAFLGAGVVSHDGGDGVSLLYSCCGWPVRVVVARRGSALASTLARAKRDGRISGYRAFDDYVAVAIGGHDGSGVLKLLG